MLNSTEHANSHRVRLLNLRDVLCGLYLTRTDIVRVARDADLPVANIAFDDKAIVSWTNVLQEASAQQRLSVLISVVRRDYPTHPLLSAAEYGALDGVRSPYDSGSIDWKDGDIRSSNLEVILGSESALVPAEFLSRGWECAHSVGRIALSDGGYGSGFIVSDQLLVTNNHVIPNASAAASASVQFDYYNSNPSRHNGPRYSLEPDAYFATSAPGDWTFVRIRSANGSPPLPPPLRAAGRLPSTGDRAHIIQHPMGTEKRVGLFNNVITYVDNRIVQYLTDTLPGSSGSPVFNDDWEIVAIHHSGGHVVQPGLPRRVFRNEGMNFGSILQEIGSAV
jgi:hypothetical protein